jgi:hypothetical protein
MSLSIKEDGNVNVLGLHPCMFFAFIVAGEVYHEHGFNCVLTSATDSKHGKHSHHFKGYAIDIRIRDIPVDIINNIVEEIQFRLQKQYQVILEGNHIHIEFDPE